MQQKTPDSIRSNAKKKALFSLSPRARRMRATHRVNH